MSSAPRSASSDFLLPVSSASCRWFVPIVLSARLREWSLSRAPLLGARLSCSIVSYHEPSIHRLDFTSSEFCLSVALISWEAAVQASFVIRSVQKLRLAPTFSGLVFEISLVNRHLQLSCTAHPTKDHRFKMAIHTLSYSYPRTSQPWLGRRCTARQVSRH